MTTYSATVRVDGDMLHTSKPLTAPDEVGDMFDSVVYALTSGRGGITSVELVVDVEGDSETPIGDSVQGTASTPLDQPEQPSAAGDAPPVVAQ